MNTKADSVRFTLSVRDQDLLHLQSEGYYVPFLLSAACYAETKRFPRITLRGIDMTGVLPACRISVHFVPEEITPEIYGKLKDKQVDEIGKELKAIFRRNMIIEARNDAPVDIRDYLRL